MKLLKTKLILIIITFIFLGCSEVDDNSQEVPVLPSEKSFIIKLDFFEPENKITKGNWNNALISVEDWNIFNNWDIYIPIEAYKEAFNHQPEFQSGQTWLWEYDFLNNYKAKLYGTYEYGIIIWDMRISLENNFDDFAWFTGWSDIDNSKGEWIIKDNFETKQDLLTIIWERNFKDETFETKYLKNKIEESGSKSYITRRIINNPTYDTELEIFEAIELNNTYINYNELDGNGRIKGIHLYNDSEWHCWDKDKSDSYCDR